MKFLATSAIALAHSPTGKTCGPLRRQVEKCKELNIKNVMKKIIHYWAGLIIVLLVSTNLSKANWVEAAGNYDIFALLGLAQSSAYPQQLVVPYTAPSTTVNYNPVGSFNSLTMRVSERQKNGYAEGTAALSATMGYDSRSMTYTATGQLNAGSTAYWKPYTYTDPNTGKTITINPPTESPAQGNSQKESINAWAGFKFHVPANEVYFGEWSASYQAGIKNDGPYSHTRAQFVIQVVNPATGYNWVYQVVDPNNTGTDPITGQSNRVSAGSGNFQIKNGDYVFYVYILNGARTQWDPVSKKGSSDCGVGVFFNFSLFKQVSS